MVLEELLSSQELIYKIDKCRSGEFADQFYSIKSLGSLICTCFKRLFAEG